jgi:predicted RNA-binding protein
MGVKGRTRWKAVLDRFIGTGLLVIVWNSRNKFFYQKNNHCEYIYPQIVDIVEKEKEPYFIRDEITTNFFT